jgi:hypothetical protein
MQDLEIRRADPGAGVRKLWTDKEVAAFLNVSVASVRRWRLTNFGPPYYRVGANIRYDPDSCREWLKSRQSGETK